MTQAKDRNRPLRAVVAAATRRRPVMLQELLQSFAGLGVPADVDVHFLIVENDTEEVTRHVVTAMKDALPGLLHYALETVPGIPMARNRALDEAAALKADLTLFVDDDEKVTPDWLGEIIATYRSGTAELIGGPIRPIRPDKPLSRLQDAVFTGWESRMKQKADRAARLLAEGGIGRVAIVTNNWLADMRLYHALGLRFDEALQFTGGSDTKFCRDARAKGVETGWSPAAIIEETMPPERLTLSYQYARGRDQSTTSFRAKIQKGGPLRAVLGVLVSVPLKALGCVGLVLSLPVTRAYGLVSIFRQAGWIVGRVRAALNRSSYLYKNTTGY